MFSLLFFCLDAKEKVTKEKIKAALFGLLRYFFPLKKKNSLRSDSFFFLTLQKAPTLHAQKVRPISDATSLRSLECMLSLYHEICHPERSEGSRDIIQRPPTSNSEAHPTNHQENIHLNERSNVESRYNSGL